MKYLLLTILSFSAIASNSYFCEIDELDEKFTDDAYLEVKTSNKGNVISIMAMPLATSFYDEITRLDNCTRTKFKNISFCQDSNEFNETQPSYVSFNKDNQILSWYGQTFNQNYSISYNCKVSK